MGKQIIEPYPFDAISLCGRRVGIADILSGYASPENDFEESTCRFIADWLNGRGEFTQETSGSTGTPKTITITRGQMISSALLTADALSLKRGHTALLCLSPSYIAGKMMLVRSFVTGMKLVVVAPSAHPFKDLHGGASVDFAALVPAQVHDILLSDESDFFNRVQTILIGGAVLDEESQRRLQAFTCRFYATYGMTETLSHIALRPLNGPHASSHYTTLKGITVTTDERQCLVIHWDNLSHSVTTNDVVDLMNDTSFLWLGRWDNIINTGGVKVLPEALEVKLETIFNSLGIHQKFFFTSKPDPKLGNKIVLVLEGSPGKETISRLRSAIESSFSKYEIPREIRSVSSFIKTASDKIDREKTFLHSSEI